VIESVHLLPPTRTDRELTIPYIASLLQGACLQFTCAGLIYTRALLAYRVSKDSRFSIPFLYFTTRHYLSLAYRGVEFKWRTRSKYWCRRPGVGADMEKLKRNYASDRLLREVSQRARFATSARSVVGHTWIRQDPSFLLRETS
jgi:hypothetical protein